MTVPDGSGAECSDIAPRLHRRVTAGVGEALNRYGSGFSEQTDIAALSVAEVRRAYEIIPKVLSPPVGQEVTADQVEQAIGEISRVLRGHRPRLMAALYRPLAIIPALTKKTGATEKTELSLNHQWLAWCWTSEAAWRALHDPPGEGVPPLTDTEVEVLVPLAARHRFLALSEPYRGGRGETGFLPEDAAHDLFGRHTGDVFLARSRQARWEWSELLGRHESLPALDGAEQAEIEAETDLLLFEYPTDGRARKNRARSARPGPPLAIGPDRRLGPGRSSPYATEDIGFASGIIERHLLPRYRVLTAAHAALALSEYPRLGRYTAAATLCLGVLTLAGALSSPWLASVPFTDQSTLDVSAILAGLTYAIGLTGLTVHGRTWALPWLLRIPAAAAIGLFIVTTMHPSWWAAAFEPTGMEIPGRDEGPEPPLGPVRVALLLALAAFAYLLANARNTGVGIGAALLRAFLVWCAAAAHSLLIALLGLAWVVPAFSENGHIFRGAWALHPDAVWAALLQAGAWCLVAGVFSQILWDDRPLTAPLTHAHWRTEQR
ncbi:hypothetical protein [Nocardiopsis protaetiae]|uniref:hypothetical protein n=1 Tax=Nocardiopsis protaetiae TaxID=3382270 RepID=UPI00387B0864